MKKRKLRSLIKECRPIEWPKDINENLLNQAVNLPQNAVISIVCQWDDLDQNHTLNYALSQTRKEAHQREYSWAPLNKAMFVIKASVRFIQCLLNQANIIPVKFQF